MELGANCVADVIGVAEQHGHCAARCAARDNESGTPAADPGCCRDRD
jgi:hypothetical protein